MSNNNIKPYLLFLLIFNFILSFLCPLQITLVFLLRDRLTFHKLIEKKVLNFSENFYKFFFTDVGISFFDFFFRLSQMLPYPVCERHNDSICCIRILFPYLSPTPQIYKGKTPNQLYKKFCYQYLLLCIFGKNFSYYKFLKQDQQ